MIRSTERILTTHAGSLPRPAGLMEKVRARRRDSPEQEAALNEALKGAVADVVQHQIDVGLDSVNDGELSRVGDPKIAWAKLQAVVDGARIASEELWR